MRLSTEQFADFTHALGGYTEPKQDERRRSTRVTVCVRVALTLLEDHRHGDRISASLCDVSARGLAVLMDHSMTNGTQFIAHLSRKQGGMVHLLCTVVHCRELSKGQSRVGAEFTCTLPAASGKDAAADQQQAQRIRASMLE